MEETRGGVRPGVVRILRCDDVEKGRRDGVKVRGSWILKNTLSDVPRVPLRTATKGFMLYETAAVQAFAC